MVFRGRPEKPAKQSSETEPEFEAIVGDELHWLSRESRIYGMVLLIHDASSTPGGESITRCMPPYTPHPAIEA